MKIYSVKLLLESTVIPKVLNKTFEEIIVLIEVSDESEIELKIREYFIDDTYENALGGQTTWSFVTILDTFEVIDTFKGNIDFKEVYSRFIPLDEHLTADEVIKLYSLDK